MILTIALLCSIVGGVVGYVIARYVVGKWISNLVLEKLQGVIDDFELSPTIKSNRSLESCYSK